MEANGVYDQLHIHVTIFVSILNVISHNLMLSRFLRAESVYLSSICSYLIWLEQMGDVWMRVAEVTHLSVIGTMSERLNFFYCYSTWRMN